MQILLLRKAQIQQSNLRRSWIGSIRGFLLRLNEHCVIGGCRKAGCSIGEFNLRADVRCEVFQWPLRAASNPRWNAPCNQSHTFPIRHPLNGPTAPRVPFPPYPAVLLLRAPVVLYGACPKSGPPRAVAFEPCLGAGRMANTCTYKNGRGIPRCPGWKVSQSIQCWSPIPDERTFDR